MTSDRIYRIQCYLLGIAAISAIISLSSKAALANNPESAKFIQPDFFFFNFGHAVAWAYVYWLSSALFLGALAIAGILENKKRKAR